MSLWLSAEYVRDVAVLIVPQVLVRPLLGAPLWPVSLRLDSSAVESLVFVRSTWTDRPWSLLTYMLLHRDANHLTNNVASLFAMGNTVYQQGGALTLWGIFLAGGIAGALDPFNLATVQWTHTLREALAPAWLVGSGSSATSSSLSSTATVTTSSMAQQFGGWWGRQASSVSEFLAPTFAAEVRNIGSSAGVAALAGASAVILLHKVIAIRNELATSPRSRDTTGTWLRLAWHGTDLVAIVGSHFAIEAVNLRGGQEWLVSHAGHVSGFLCGAAIMSVVILFSPSHQPRSHRGR
eukprot:m.215560 g.215560  ORF g.215560 m.215560 type:complete len:294 (+) comp27942_c0_seq1:186-1067(+)